MLIGFFAGVNNIHIDKWFSLFYFSHIKTEYTLFVPDSFHLRDGSGLVRMLDSLVSTENRSPIVAAGAQGQNEQVPECNKIAFDYRSENS